MIQSLKKQDAMQWHALLRQVQRCCTQLVKLSHMRIVWPSAKPTGLFRASQWKRKVGLKRLPSEGVAVYGHLLAAGGAVPIAKPHP